ncbi:hypothetical protein M427DRAFT_149611 [Gonapodya prolifera JEL478]|uniref:Uncharacterized protein n=1 Tax=Gonapodya prolifera (strain JEL478) TaxID=1344416 RepID=A0A138ZYS4_GONPJ|nr:hypothetical protein M427DRAFT_149611 [Gonapodya prolifera JEL478]|eukprot:KXS09662.1 hypothetical protein M427DRAFT_149611 [Gonapodya prolifera JEL478]
MRNDETGRLKWINAFLNEELFSLREKKAVGSQKQEAISVIEHIFRKVSRRRKPQMHVRPLARADLAIVTFAILLFLPASSSLAFPVGSHAKRQQSSPPYFVVVDPIDRCWGDNPASFVVNLHISVAGAPPNAATNGGLAVLTLSFLGAAAVSQTQTWNVANSVTSGNTWAFQTMDGQPNVGGVFAVQGVVCSNGMLITPPSFSVNGSLLSGAGPVAALVQNLGVISSTLIGVSMISIGPPTYSLGTSFGMCWSISGTTYISLSGVLSVNGHTPSSTSDGGLAKLSVEFLGATSITPLQTWSVSGSLSKNNVWSFTTINGAANIGGIFSATGVSCDANGQMFPPIATRLSGSLVTGGEIQVGLMVPAVGDLGASTSTQDADGGTASATLVPIPPTNNYVKTVVPSVSVPPTVAGAPTYTFTFLIDRCWGGGSTDVFFPFRLTLNVNGHQPLDNVDGGLAAISITFEGLPIVKMSSVWVVGNSMTTGATWRLETMKNGPNPGGILSTTSPVTCNDGVLSVAPTLTFAGYLLGGGPTAPINIVANAL